MAYLMHFAFVVSFDLYVHKKSFIMSNTSNNHFLGIDILRGIKGNCKGSFQLSTSLNELFLNLYVV